MSTQDAESAGSSGQVRDRPKVIKVTRRQIRAAQISVKAHEQLGKPVSPGLKRIAEAKRAS